MRRVLVVLCIVAVIPNVAFTQSRDSAKTPASSVVPVVTPACCSIVRIEVAKALVTARETATGFTFRFEVKTKRVLSTLKIGQAVWADFAAKTVKLKATDVQSCCAIVDTPPPEMGSLGSGDNHRRAILAQEDL